MTIHRERVSARQRPEYVKHMIKSTADDIRKRLLGSTIYGYLIDLSSEDDLLVGARLWGNQETRREIEPLLRVKPQGPRNVPWWPPRAPGTEPLPLRIRSAWRALRGRCCNCGKRPGDEARYGRIQYVVRGECDQCSCWGESRL